MDASLGFEDGLRPLVRQLVAMLVDPAWRSVLPALAGTTELNETLADRLVGQFMAALTPAATR